MSTSQPSRLFRHVNMIGVNEHRFQILDAVRFSANYLVVAIHFTILLGGGGNHGGEYALWRWISQSFAPIAMPTLFFISGYLFYLGDGYLGKIRRRIGRLLVPYFAWNLIVGVLFAMLCVLGINKAASADLTSPMELICWLLRKTLSLWNAPADMPTWYIRAILAYCVLSPFLSIFLRGRYLLVRLAVLLLGISAFEYYLGKTGRIADFLYTYPPYSLLCFCCGGAVAVSRLGFERFCGKKRLAWLLVGACALMIHVIFPCPPGLSCWLKLCEVLILFAVAPELLKVYLHVPELIRTASFWVYVSHLPIFLFLGIFVPKLPFNSTTLLLAVGVVAMLIISLGVFVLVRRLSPLLVRALNGQMKI